MKDELLNDTELVKETWYHKEFHKLHQLIGDSRYSKLFKLFPDMAVIPCIFASVVFSSCFCFNLYLIIQWHWIASKMNKRNLLGWWNFKI